MVKRLALIHRPVTSAEVFDSTGTHTRRRRVASREGQTPARLRAARNAGIPPAREKWQLS
ncbi:hypothetical protein CA85_34430 [Allorhodopirellula solitaria]|uniref:Uncharacterized protein n=1 Tax=Allorhodopirellula solitaria TaxID=2527987 RepID=A0A5C5XPF5_9BACT|nr:hypothetical protein CA85_34430 [Allorhodopirellula solitaria]